ncbi:hypothetical protein GALL_449320 [mine drainage metagenome]|uniref:Uncharacterized protein n=1 Tax=mine drainage metagenome TaxID=410659 RepID=A0A1J5PPC3_9ZZZZ
MGILGNPVLHIGAVLDARKSSGQGGQPTLAQPAFQLVAIQVVRARIAATEVKVHRPCAHIAADEARKRPDPRPRTDQDHRRFAARGAEIRVRLDEGRDLVARLKAVQEAGTLAPRMFAHTNLQEPVAGRGRQRIEPRHVAVRRQDAHQVTGIKARQTVAVSDPLPQGLRSFRRHETQHGRRCLHFVAVIDSLDQFQQTGARRFGLVQQGQIYAQTLAHITAPACKLLHRLTVNGVVGQHRIPQLGIQRLCHIIAELAELGELTVAKSQQSHREVRRMRDLFQTRHERLGRGRCRAIAVGRGQYEHPFGMRVMLAQAIHRPGMHPLPSRRQRVMQGACETPSGVAIAAHKDDRIRRMCRMVMRKARQRAAATPPDHRAGCRHDRRAQRSQAQQQPQRPETLAGVQHVNRLINLAHQAVRQPAKHLAGGLIDKPLPGRGADRKDIRRVGRKGQIAQVRQWNRLQCIKLRDWQRRAAIHRRRKRRLRVKPVGNHLQVGHRHPESGEGRQKQAKDGKASHLDVQPLRCGATCAGKHLTPAAHTLRQHERARDAKRDHRKGGKARDPPARIAHKQRPVQVGHPDDKA